MGRRSSGCLWSGTWPLKAADMLRSDLETAREEWLEQAERQPDEHARQEEIPFLRQDTDEGTIDFHALRHTFISNLAESGVHPRWRRNWPAVRQSR
jgi:hypothetical protein